MFWEHSPYWISLPLTGWEQSSPVDEEKIKIKMDDGVASFFIRFGGNLLICWRCSLVSKTQNEIVVSWNTLWGVMKVHWLDFSLLFGSCCLLQVRAEACISLQASWEWSSLDSLNHIRRTKSSIKKRIIVCQSVWSMFGEQTCAPVKNGL